MFYFYRHSEHTHQKHLWKIARAFKKRSGCKSDQSKIDITYFNFHSSDFISYFLWRAVMFCASSGASHTYAEGSWTGTDKWSIDYLQLTIKVLNVEVSDTPGDATYTNAGKKITCLCDWLRQSATVALKLKIFTKNFYEGTIARSCSCCCIFFCIIYVKTHSR